MPNICNNSLCHPKSGWHLDPALTHLDQVSNTPFDLDQVTLYDITVHSGLILTEITFYFLILNHPSGVNLD